MQSGSLIIDIAGTELSNEDKKLLKHPLVAGVILFSRNIQNVLQTQKLNAQIKSLRPDLLIAVDQEGGRVQRLKEGFTKLPPMAKLEKIADRNFAVDWGWLLAVEVLACGFDFSFTPVLDVNHGSCSVIGDRAISSKPDKIIELASAFIKGLHEAGMAVTGKHFPGHGFVAGDSHLTLPKDNRTLEEIMRTDLEPFSKIIKQGIEAIMPAHIVYSQVDNKAAGFSKRWMQEILCKQLGFKGIIISDDLDMKGADTGKDYKDRSISAFTAGCDIALLCNNRLAAIEALRGLENEGVRPTQKSLLELRAKHKYNFPELQKLARWQKTRNRLQNLLD